MVAARLLPVSSWLNSFNTWVADLGWLGMFIFILVYIFCAVAFVPGSVLTLGAGFAFGLLSGSIAVSIASTTGAALAFLIARYFLRERFTKRFAGNAKFKAIDKAISKEGAKIVFLLRLTPVMPFNLGNYLFGLTGIPFWHYVGASWVGMIPGTIFYVYLGALGRTTVEAAAGEAAMGKLVVQGLALIAMIAVTVVITRIARRALKATELEEDSIHPEP
jgi:uncharacterized membrane protein YdjX (TVP38/TMEM64 family)